MLRAYPGSPDGVLGAEDHGASTALDAASCLVMRDHVRLGCVGNDS
jgi:hypothetical protein